MRTLVALLLLNAANSTLASAQDRSLAYMDVTLGVNVLVSDGPFDGVYYDRGNAMALLAFGTQPDVSRSFIASLHVGVLNVAGSGGDVCRSTPLGGCYQDYPLNSRLLEASP